MYENMVMFWEKAEYLANSKVYRQFAETDGPITKLDLRKANVDVSQGNVRLASIVNIRSQGEPLYTRFEFEVPQLKWTEETEKSLEEIANKYGLQLSNFELVVGGTAFVLKDKGRKGIFPGVAEIYSDEIKIRQQYERGEELFEDIIKLYGVELSKALVPSVLGGEVVEGEFCEESKRKRERMQFYDYVDPLLEKLKDADAQEGSAILHQIKIAAEKAREDGVDDGEIRAIEQTAEMAAGMITGLSFLEDILNGMAGEEDKKD